MGYDKRARRWAWSAMAVLSVAAAACGTDDGAAVREIGDDGAASGSGSGSASGVEPTCQPVGDFSVADSQLDVTLGDFYVSPQGPAVAGKVNIVATNVGDEPHEVVVVVGDDVAALPTDADGAFDEEAYGTDRVLGEIEAFPAGEDCNGVFDLAPGSYVLLCNLVETEADGTIESHFAEGMATVIAVGS